MASFWDEFKDLFKTKSQREEERQQQLKDALASENELVSKLAELERQYNQSKPQEQETDINKLFPEDSGLKEIEYTPKSDAEIAAQAQKEIAAKKSEAQKKLQEELNSEAQNLSETKAKAGQSLKESYKNLENLYSDLRSKAENESLKRGMQRSSVILGQLGNLDEAHMESAGEVEKAYGETVAAIDAEMAALNSDRDKALEQLDLKYASELDKKISDLKKERDSTVSEYEKYNNKIREQNRDYAREREEDIAEYLVKQEKDRLAREETVRQYEAKYGYSGEKLENYNRRYDLAYDFYMSMSPEIAADALKSSPNMKYYLGLNYDKLLDALSQRAGNVKKYY